MKQLTPSTVPLTHPTAPIPSTLAENDLHLEDETCWKTNLMLDEEEERVQQRDLNFRRRTSFEENLVNDYLQLMKDVL